MANKKLASGHRMVGVKTISQSQILPFCYWL